MCYMCVQVNIYRYVTCVMYNFTTYNIHIHVCGNNLFTLPAGM
jgi:hypothetical protein